MIDAATSTDCGPVRSLASSNDGVVYAGFTDGTVKQFDLQARCWVDPPRGHPLEGGPRWLKATDRWIGTVGAVAGMDVTPEGYLFTTSDDFTACEFWVAEGSGVGRERRVSNLYDERRDDNSLGRPWVPIPPMAQMSASFTSQVSAHSLEMSHLK